MGDTKKQDQDRVLLGQIGAAHGIKGEVRIKSFTNAPLDIITYGPLTTNRPDLTIIIKNSRLSKGLVIASIDGISDRNQAETLNGVELFTEQKNLAEISDDDEFYYSDLIGLEARDVDGKVIGQVASIDNYGAGDILEVKLANGKTELLIFSTEVAPEINIADGFITLIMPDIVIAKESDA